MTHVEVRQPALQLRVAALLRRVVVALARQKRRPDRRSTCPRSTRRAATDRARPSARRAAAARGRPTTLPAPRAGCRRSRESAGARRPDPAQAAADSGCAFAPGSLPHAPTQRTVTSMPRTRASTPRLPCCAYAVAQLRRERVHRGGRLESAGRRETDSAAVGGCAPGTNTRQTEVTAG